MTITVYTRPACVQCVATKTWLRARGVTFVEVDVTQDEEAFAWAAATGIRQMPIVVADGCDPFGGFDTGMLQDVEMMQGAGGA